MAEEKRAYILVEIRAEDDVSVRRAVAKARRALHSVDTGSAGLADLVYYENRGPAYANVSGLSIRLVNRWPELKAIFDTLPWRNHG